MAKVEEFNEKEWEAEQDADALSRAMAVRKDKKRLAAAVKASKRMVKKKVPQMEENVKRQKEEISGLKSLSTRKAKAFS